MKSYFLSVIGVALLFFISCGVSEEELTVDCSLSELTVEEVGTSDADCSILGSLEVEATGGSGNVKFSVDEINFQSSSTFSLAAGTYTVTAKDSNGCLANTSVTIEAAANSISISALQSDAATCGEEDSQITVIASGGTGTLQYRLDQGEFQTANSFDGLGQGVYEVTVRDEEGCETVRTERVLTNVSLENDIMPIVSANCVVNGSCHNSAAPRVNLSVKSNVLSRASSIKSRTRSGSMPPASRPDLTQSEIDLIACWVDDGAKDN